MNQITRYILRLAILVAAAILGPLLMVSALSGFYSDDLALRIVGAVLALALFVNPRGVIELFLNKAHSTLLTVMVAALPSLADET